MDTESVRLFVLAAEKLNISAAGRELGMAPAVASARLAKLERDLGTDLLRRSTRRVSLSVDGEDFLPYAREILDQEEAGRAALGQGRTKPSGVLRFAASSTFAQLHIIPLISEFQTLYPDVTLDMRLSDTRFDLIEGSFDLALRNQSLEDSSLKARKLCDDMRVLCASPEYVAERGAPETPEDLKRHTLIGFQSKEPRSLISADGAQGEFNPAEADCKLVLDDGLSQKLATMAGAGISANSLWSVHAELASGVLCRIMPEWVIEDGTALWLVYPKSNVLTAKARVLIDFLVDRVGQRMARVRLTGA